MSAHALLHDDAEATKNQFAESAPDAILYPDWERNPDIVVDRNQAVYVIVTGQPIRLIAPPTRLGQEFTIVDGRPDSQGGSSIVASQFETPYDFDQSGNDAITFGAPTDGGFVTLLSVKVSDVLEWRVKYIGPDVTLAPLD